MIDAIHIALGAAAFLGGGLGALAAVRIELRYLRRDVRRAQHTADLAHTRIDSLVG